MTNQGKSHSYYFSICIPAYKNAGFIKRLLESVAAQTFRDFEVVLTDDSPDRDVEVICDQFKGFFELSYSRNEPALGTPQNWNESMRKAKGKWIKMMHDDDWFASPKSLQTFADFTLTHPATQFFFSSFRKVDLDSGASRDYYLKKSQWRALRHNPKMLFSGNIIGHPSVALHRNQKGLVYDSNLKWLVDIDFYIRCLEAGPVVYIPSVLVCIGMGAQQLSTNFFLQRTIEIPESFYLLNKMGLGSLQNVRVYDGWWRLLRNLHLGRQNEIKEAGYQGDIPSIFVSMIKWQNKLPRFFLDFGPGSKSAMFIHYLLHRNRLSEIQPLLPK